MGNETPEPDGDGDAVVLDEIAELFCFHLVALTRRKGPNGKDIWHPWTIGAVIQPSLERACDAFGLDTLPEPHPRAAEGYVWAKAEPGSNAVTRLLYARAPKELRELLPKRRPSPFFDFDKDVRWAIQRIPLLD